VTLNSAARPLLLLLLLRFCTVLLPKRRWALSPKTSAAKLTAC